MADSHTTAIAQADAVSPCGSEESDFSIAPMTNADYEAVRELWRAALPTKLNRDDSAEAIARYLARNPGLSFVARSGARLVGAVLGGHDGRRGYLHHLAVAADCRRRGLGSTLVRCCLAALSREGFAKTHVFVQNSNPSALAYWQQRQWQQRDDLTVYTFIRTSVEDM
jgi:N-acetylglutamate synthase